MENGTHVELVQHSAWHGHGNGLVARCLCKYKHCPAIYLPFKEHDLSPTIDWNGLSAIHTCKHTHTQSTKEEPLEYDMNSKPTLLNPGMLQDLMTEVRAHSNTELALTQYVL